MKKVFVAACAAASMMFAFAVCANAETFGATDNLEWELDKTTGTLTISGTGVMPDYENVNTLPWYTSRGSINSVVISDGVTSIGKNSFNGCSSLTDVTLGKDVDTIGNSAFYNAQNIEEIVFPSSLKTIGNASFYHCYALSKTNLADCPKIEKIDASAFNGDSALTSVYLNVTSDKLTIGGRAFQECSGLTTVYVKCPKLEMSAGNSFLNCTALTKAVFDASAMQGNLNNNNTTFEGANSKATIYVSSAAENSFKGKVSDLTLNVINKAYNGTVVTETEEDDITSTVAYYTVFVADQDAKTLKATREDKPSTVADIAGLVEKTGSLFGIITDYNGESDVAPEITITVE